MEDARFKAFPVGRLQLRLGRRLSLQQPDAVELVAGRGVGAVHEVDGVAARVAVARQPLLEVLAVRHAVRFAQPRALRRVCAGSSATR